MKEIIFENLKIQQGVDFGKLTTMKIRGKSHFFITVKNIEDFRSAVKFSKINNLPIFILGGGSNTIVKSQNFKGVVVKNEIKGFEKIFENDESIEFHINSGENWHNFVNYAVSKGLSGCEAMAMIPGTVGALPIQNVGAYGQEIADILKSVEVLEISTGKIKTLLKSECEFAYRDSVFKNDAKGKYFIVSVNLKLLKSRPEMPEYKALKEKLRNIGKNEENLTAKDVMNAVIEIRSKKLPDPEKIANSGSFFKNAIISKEKAIEICEKYQNVPLFEAGENYKIATGWLIEQSGLKGKEFFGMKIYSENALVLTNISAKSYNELAQARKIVQDRVFEKFGLKIEQEPLEI